MKIDISEGTRNGWDSGVVTSFFRQFGWFGAGFGHGAYHLCQNTCFVFWKKLRPWIIKVDDDGLWQLL